MVTPPRLEKLVEIILYLAEQLKQKGLDSNLYHILKLTYFADKEQLGNTGRFVSGDRYFALEKGPVPTTLYDIIKFIQGREHKLDESKLDFVREAFITEGNLITPLRSANLKWLSGSNRRCLDNSIDTYGNMSIGKLIEISHDAAYKKTERNREIKIEDIAMTLEHDEEIIEYLHAYKSSRRF